MRLTKRQWKFTVLPQQFLIHLVRVQLRILVNNNVDDDDNGSIFVRLRFPASAFFPCWLAKCSSFNSYNNFQDDLLRSMMKFQHKRRCVCFRPCPIFFVNVCVSFLRIFIYDTDFVVDFLKINENIQVQIRQHLCDSTAKSTWTFSVDEIILILVWNACYWKVFVMVRFPF